MNEFYKKFSRAAARFPDKPAIEVQRRDGLERFTYAELHRMAESAAAFLAERGLSRGDRCAILAENDAHWCAAYLGVLRLGAVAVPLDTNYDASQVAKLLADSGSAAIVASRRFMPVCDQALRDAPGDCRGFLLRSGDGPTDADAIDFDRAAPADPPAPASGDDPALILYTSGTTHDPKGVVLTHGNLQCELEAVLSIFQIDDDDTILGVLPLFHALAQIANLVIPLSVGSTVVFLETLNTTELLRALDERKVTVFCCVPQFFYLIHERVFDRVAAASRPVRLLFRAQLRLAGMLRERFGINLGRRLFGRVHRVLGPRMRLLVTGGSRFDPRIGRDLYALGFNILQAYGLTETTGGATVLREGDKHVDSVGYPLPGVEIDIVPSEVIEADEVVDANRKVGEILIRGPVVSPGYYRRPEINAVAFADGWLHTGDLGYRDDEGRLYVTGRAKDVIVLSSGKNIYPEEIEAHYLRSPYIKELCVMGRARQGEPAAERLHAVVVPDFDLLRAQKIVNSRDILRFEIENLSAQVPSHKRILGYSIVQDALPRTTTRKLKRFVIERQFAGVEAQAVADAPASAPERDPTWAADPHVSAALEIIRDSARERGDVWSAANLELDLGLDSMGRVELLVALETRFGVSLPDEVSQRLYTVRELVEAVRPGDGATAADAAPARESWEQLLKDTPDDDGSIAATLASKPWFAVIEFALLKLLYGLAWLLLGFRVSGRENLPSRGPYLLSPNHQSFLDGFLLVSALPYRVLADTFFVGASEYFRTSLMARIARLISVVPVDPDTNLLRAMRAGAAGLREGKVLILFPEGERSIDAEMKTFKKGAAILSASVGAPIVPVALDGAFDVWPRAGAMRWSRLLPFSGARIRMRFGPPLAPATGDRQVDADHAALTARLRSAVEALLGSLRGRPVAG